MTSVDSLIFEFFNSLIGKSFLIDGIFVFLAKYLIYFLVFIFLLYAFRIKNWKERMRVFTIGILATILSRGILTPLIRFFVERQRPFILMDAESLIGYVGERAFPSGHMAFIVPLMIVLWYVNKRVGTWGLIGAFLIGIARIGAGVHWPSDVVGGFLVGVVSYAIVRIVLKRKFSGGKENTVVNPLG